MNKVFSVGPDWYVAERREDLEKLWLEHHGATHEQMTGEPFPWDEVVECDPKEEFKFYDEGEEMLTKAAQMNGFFIFNIGDGFIIGTFENFAELNGIGFLASTEW